ncbi:hypothetical protein D3C80_675440 [compost metagenome]
MAKVDLAWKDRELTKVGTLQVHAIPYQLAAHVEHTRALASPGSLQGVGYSTAPRHAPLPRDVFFPTDPLHQSFLQCLQLLVFFIQQEP